MAAANPVGAAFYGVLIVAFVCKLFDVIQVIVNVVTVNAFFIDWEQVCIICYMLCVKCVSDCPYYIKGVGALQVIALILSISGVTIFLENLTVGKTLCW